MQTKATLPVRSRCHYQARPSTTDPGCWTIMEQVAGETRLRLFARARDVHAAARILNGLILGGAEVETIKPVGRVSFLGITFDGTTPNTLHADVYADGSAWCIETGGTRICKRDMAEHAIPGAPADYTLADAVANIMKDEGILLKTGGAS